MDRALSQPCISIVERPLRTNVHQSGLMGSLLLTGLMGKTVKSCVPAKLGQACFILDRVMAVLGVHFCIRLSHRALDTWLGPLPSFCARQIFQFSHVQ